MSFDMSSWHDPANAFNWKLHWVTMLDWRPFNKSWILWEVHWLGNCDCSHCRRAEKSWPIFVWFPHWRYIFGNGWTTIGIRLQRKVHYLRLN